MRCPSRNFWNGKARWRKEKGKESGGKQEKEGRDWEGKEEGGTELRATHTLTQRFPPEQRYGT